jgi:hypothetical protein
MAVRRAKIKQQFEQAIPSVLEPGEMVQAETWSLSGPSPWLIGLLGWVVMLLMGSRYYFMVVTDRRVLFMRTSMMTSRPQGLAWADPRNAVQVHDVELGNTVWSKFRYRRPDGKEMRINIHRFWRDDGQAVVAALTSQAAPQPAWPQTPPQTPASGQFQV